LVWLSLSPIMGFTMMAHRKPPSSFLKSFTSSVFDVEAVDFSGTRESIVRGGRDQFPKVSRAFEGINSVGVIGWGSQAPAQAQNLKDTFQSEGIDISVTIGLRSGSSSAAQAKEQGFEVGEMFDVIGKSDMIVLLISDAAQSQLYTKIFAAMKPGATLGLSHGFLLGYLDSINESFPADMPVILVAPKGMGPSVRRLYEQGKSTNGAGINSSFAVHQGGQKARELALGWGIAIGSPFMFETTLRDEYRSDIYGERGILLGGVHAIIEGLYRRFQRVDGMTKEDAFLNSAESITGVITKIISKDGILKLYEELSANDKKIFESAYSASYSPSKEILQECYDEVKCGNEIRSVIMQNERVISGKGVIGKIDGTDAWVTGEKVRANREDDKIPQPVHSWSLRGYDDGSDRYPHGRRTQLLRDHQRECHRGGGLSCSVHALPWSCVHGRQLLVHGKVGKSQVGTKVRLHLGTISLHQNRQRGKS